MFAGFWILVYTITIASGPATNTQGQPLKYPHSDIAFEPPVESGKYTFKFEVATDGGQLRQVKTYTAGRITGMKYDQGNPILLIGDSLAVPMSQLIQIRG